MSDTKPLTRAQQQRQGPQDIVEMKANRPASETGSPLEPMPIEVEYAGRTYTGAFDYESVSDRLYRRYQLRAGFVVQKTEKHLPDGKKIEPGFDITPYINDIPEELILDILEVTDGSAFREDKVAMYVPHLLEWDVKDKEGKTAEISVEAFNARGGGIYQAFLNKMDEVFTELQPKVPEEIETPKPEK